MSVVEFRHTRRSWTRPRLACPLKVTMHPCASSRNHRYLRPGPLWLAPPPECRSLRAQEARRTGRSGGRDERPERSVTRAHHPGPTRNRGLWATSQRWPSRSLK
jgi:hypothetical protein